MKTEFTRGLRKELEAELRRLAEAKERGEWPGTVDDDEREDLAGLSMTAVLHRGRARAAARK